MRRSRQVIAIVVLASALAADGALHATPVSEREASTSALAARLVQRISVGLRRTIAAPQLFAAQQTHDSAALTRSAPPMQSQTAAPIAGLMAPFQLRLPPPLA